MSRKDRKTQSQEHASKHVLGVADRTRSPYCCNIDFLQKKSCNRCAYCFKTLFAASLQACSTIVTTIWRPGLRHSQPKYKNPVFYEGVYCTLKGFNLTP